MPHFRVLSACIGSCLILLLAGSARAAQVELVSRAVPELRSDTAMGISSTEIDFDGSRFIFARPSRVSADGRWIVFASDAPNLIPGQVDGNQGFDVFLHDRVSGSTILVSRAAGSSATPANNDSFRPSISADGRYVAYISQATNLVPGQVDELPQFFAGEEDIFLFDRDTGTTVLASRKDGTTATGAGGDSLDPIVSGDGRFVAFRSGATDLVPGQVGTWGLFLYERASGAVRVVSHQSSSENAVGYCATFAVSGDGNWIVFLSGEADLVPGQSGTSSGDNVFLYETASGAITLVSHASGSPTTVGDGGADGFDMFPSISSDGSRLVFSSHASNLDAGVTDANSLEDVFLYDRLSGTNTLVSRSGSPAAAVTGAQAVLSGDGGTVAFMSTADNLIPGQIDASGTNVFLYDVATGAMVLASHASGSALQEANEFSMAPILGSDGNFVAFLSSATDLVPGQTDEEFTEDLFLYDRAAGTTVMVSHAGNSSVTSATVPGGSWFRHVDPFLRGSGRWVVFTSCATNLLSGLRDRNRRPDVFLYDRLSGNNTAVSIHAPSLPSLSADDESTLASLSADGRFVAFLSRATDLVAGQEDVNGTGNDLFLFDRETGENILVSHTPSSPSQTGNGFMGVGWAAISRDGRFIVFSSDATNLVPGQIDSFGSFDIFLYERATGAVTLVSHAAGSPGVAANDDSRSPTISGDGRFIAYTSRAPNLVSGQNDSNSFDVFLYDRLGATTLVSHASGLPTATANGASGFPMLSADGRFLAFESEATDLIAGQSDANGAKDVFLYDRTSGSSALVSHANGLPGTTADQVSWRPVLSGNGRFVAFCSGASNLVSSQIGDMTSVFLYDRATGSSALVSHASSSSVTTANADSCDHSIDDNGDFVAFNSRATNLVPGQIDRPPIPLEGYDIFLYDRSSTAITLLSHTAGSLVTTGNGLSWDPRISGNGNHVAFSSSSTDLVGDNPDSGQDVFLYNRLTGVMTLLNPPNATPHGPRFDFYASRPLISQDGRSVAFSGTASNLVAQDFNLKSDVFLWSDPSPARDFFTLEPCRLLDTREPGQGPALTSGILALLDVHAVCGIPVTARAIAANVTVTEPAGLGHLALFPGDYLRPPATSTINFRAGQTRANNAILPLADNGTLGLYAVIAGGGTVNVIVDVVGYFE